MKKICMILFFIFLFGSNSFAEESTVIDEIQPVDTICTPGSCSIPSHKK